MAFSIDVEPANHLIIDLFPADVRVAGSPVEGLEDELRVIVTDNYFYVLEDSAEGPHAAIKEPLTSFEGTNKTGYTVTTAEGNTYFFLRANNCGCGSRLRGIHPFPGVGFAARPR